MDQPAPYLEVYNGRLVGIRKWEDLDALWKIVQGIAGENFYVYAIGEEPPHETVSAEKLVEFIAGIDDLLHREHDEDYCGIVYVDDREKPSFIKIYDPNNLGMVCGSSDEPPLPGWTLSKQVPVDLPNAFPPPGNRRRWWRSLFGG
jgi:hypothetical protein